jgi:hypothetical protein
MTPYQVALIEVLKTHPNLQKHQEEFLDVARELVVVASESLAKEMSSSLAKSVSQMTLAMASRNFHGVQSEVYFNIVTEMAMMLLSQVAALTGQGQDLSDPEDIEVGFPKGNA